MEEAQKLIKKSRPEIKENSLKIYISNLSKLKKIFEADDLNFLNDIDEVKEKIKDLHYTTQRNYYNSIIIYLKAKDKDLKIIDKYDDIRNELNSKYITDNQNNKISEKQKDAFVDIKELYKMIDMIGDELKNKKIKKQSSLSSKDKALLQVYIILNILIKIPLRNEIATLESITKTQFNKETKEEQNTNNYLVVENNKMFFVLNEYKTSKKYKQKIINIPKDLEKLLRMYIKINGMGILFKTSTNKQITTNELSKILLKTSKKYLDKNISTTIIRKIVLSDLFAENKKQQLKMSEITGHSVETMNNIYIKEK
jgi:hypothetical protein